MAETSKTASRKRRIANFDDESSDGLDPASGTATKKGKQTLKENAQTTHDEELTHASNNDDETAKLYGVLQLTVFPEPC